MTRQDAGFYAKQQLTNCFRETKEMKRVLDLDEEPPAIEQYKGAATKLKSELPTNIKMERITLLKFSSLTEGIHVKIREASQNTDFDAQKLLEIDKALQSVQGAFANNSLKLTEIDRCTEKRAKN